MQDYYELMNLNAIEFQMKKDFEIEEAIKKAFREAAMKHHPDKGGDEETFKELNHARDVLIDPTRRKAYDAMLKAIVQSEIYSDDHRPGDIPHSTETLRTFQATVPFEDIQQEYEAYFRDKMGDEAVASEHGYHSEYAYDPKTGRDILVLHFPNEAVANEFIGQMIGKGLIKDPEILQDERAADTNRFSPFKNYAETPCLDRD